MGNGVTERFNRTLGSMLRSLPLKEKQKWPEQIQALTFAYNATVHETTGYAPFQLMFGRIPKLPVDVIFGQVFHDPMVVDHSNYVQTLMSHLKEAAYIAQKHTEKEQRKQANFYNRKVKGLCLNVGDRVLLANKGERGKKKLADRWDPNVHTVKDRDLRANIYKVIDGKGKSKVVHRNLILDISFLPIEPTQDEDVLSSAGNVETKPCMSDLFDPTDGGGSDDRMGAWVSDEQGEVEGQESVCGDLESDYSAECCSPNEVAGDCSDRMNDEDGESYSSTLDQQVRAVNDSNTNHITDMPAHTSDDTQSFRTRAGRVVKKVSRLIESMTQKSPVVKRAGSFLSQF
ncbi:uncharacterized protein LOC132851087 [Tachysurus vachellii]|uniref:uncharacterized protein LOC132851087 n=1 Tax=Tachysurus vachellii TaxID=175792 RepID=UPI00296AD244|nr:uncharacterized protein LOC132851087 [Tachysurus vachellii]